jgi:predicted transcriptional regulator
MLKEAGFEQRRVFSGRFWVGIGLQDGDNVTQRGRVAKLSKEGLTGVEIAKQLGVHKSTVSRHLQAIKTGRPYGRKKKSSKNPVPTTALQAIENGAYRAMKEFLATAEDQVLEAISAIYHEGTVEQSDGRPENPLF